MEQFPRLDLTVRESSLAMPARARACRNDKGTLVPDFKISTRDHKSVEGAA
jgi:hypothetical protein